MKKHNLAAAILSLAAPLSTAGARDMTMTTIEVAPWASQDPETHRYVGFFPSVVAEIERRTGLHITLTLHPFPRIDHDLESGDEDCATFIWNDYRAAYVEKGELVTIHATGVIARKGLRLKSYDDLKGMTISVLRNMKLDARFDNDTSLKKEFDPDYLTGLNKIVHHRLDAIVGALVPIHFLARNRGWEGDLGDELTLGAAPLVLQCSKNRAIWTCCPS